MITARYASLALMMTAASLAFTACQREEPSDLEVLRSGEDGTIYGVDDDDQRMQDAIARARETVEQFITALQHPRTGQESFAIKWPAVVADGVEHIWLDSVVFENDQFIGQVANVPDSIPDVKLGDRITLPRHEISDWMYVDHGTLVGGYTLRAILEMMSPEESQDMKASLPFEID